MTFLLIILYNLVYCISYQFNIIGISIFAASLSIIFIISFIFLKRGNNLISCLIALMSASIPMSFRNVFGGSFGELPINWFYIIGLFVAILEVLNILKNYKIIKFNKFDISCFFIILLSAIPLMNSEFKKYSIDEFINYLFFITLIFISFINIQTISKKEYKDILSIYNKTVIISSIITIIQFISYESFGIKLLRVEFFGGGRLYFSYLFGDMSSATVYFATAILFILFDKKESLRKYINILIIIIAMAVSSARSGLVSLILVLMIYFAFGKKRSIKIKSLLFFLLSLPLIVYFSSMVRKFNSAINYLTNSTGRIEGYLDGLRIFSNNPIFGSGYDLSYKFTLVGKTVPHNSIIYMMAQMGIILTILYLLVFYRIYKLADIKKLEDMKYAIMASYIGSMIIPGFIASRFFTVIALIVILVQNENIKKEKLNEKF